MLAIVPPEHVPLAQTALPDDVYVVGEIIAGQSTVGIVNQ
jgi:hypothetical protein